MNKLMWMLLGVLATIIFVTSGVFIAAQIASLTEDKEITRDAKIGRYNIKKVTDFQGGDIKVERIILGTPGTKLVVFNNALVIDGNLKIRGNLEVKGCIRYNDRGVRGTLGTCI